MTKEQIVNKYGKFLAKEKHSVSKSKGELEVIQYAYKNKITFKKALKEIISMHNNLSKEA